MKRLQSVRYPQALGNNRSAHMCTHAHTKTPNSTYDKRCNLDWRRHLVIQRHANFEAAALLLYFHTRVGLAQENVRAKRKGKDKYGRADQNGCCSREYSHYQDQIV